MPFPSILGEVLCRVERHATKGRWSEQCAANKKIRAHFRTCTPPTPLELGASEDHGGRAVCGTFVLGHRVRRRDRQSGRIKIPSTPTCSDP